MLSHVFTKSAHIAVAVGSARSDYREPASERHSYGVVGAPVELDRGKLRCGYLSGIITILRMEQPNAAAPVFLPCRFAHRSRWVSVDIQSNTPCRSAWKKRHPRRSTCNLVTRVFRFITSTLKRACNWSSHHRKTRLVASRLQQYSGKRNPQVVGAPAGCFGALLFVCAI